MSKLYGYEGGISCAAPAFNTTLTSAVDAATTAIPVASAVGLIAGTPLLVGQRVDDDHVVAGNTLTVTRGAYGSTAASHASGSSLAHGLPRAVARPDLQPQLVLRRAGPLSDSCSRTTSARLNQYALCMGAADGNSYYGAYHTPWQQHGRGDGSDGKADNRLTLACPGKARSKSATTNQDVVNVSVRGQAFIDWMKPAQVDIPPGKKRRTIFPFYRNRARR